MLNKANNKNGFTLIEIIITIAILLMIIIPINSLFLTTTKTNRNSADKMMAIILAQRKMEEIKANKAINLNPESIKEGSFTIETNITEMDEYKFMSTPTLNYDIKIDTDKNGKYIIIKNNSGNEIITDDFQLDILLENTFLYCTTDSGDIKENIENDIGKLKVKISENIDLYINANNESQSKNLIIYIIKGNLENITINNKGGKVQVYRDVEESEIRDYNSRLYKVEIMVTKSGKLIQKIIGYKSIVD